MDPNASTHVPPLRAADVLALQDRLLADASWPGAAPPPQAGAGEQEDGKRQRAVKALEQRRGPPPQRGFFEHGGHKPKLSPLA